MAFEIVGFEGPSRSEGGYVENITGRTFATREEAQQFILRETKKQRSGGGYLPYEERFAGSFAQRFGYKTGEIRETSQPTQKTFISQPLSRSTEEGRRENLARLERRQAGISREEEKLLTNLEKAEKKGDISPRSAKELKANIINRDELAAFASERKRQREEIAGITSSIESQPIGTSAGQMLKLLPEEYRTPQSVRSIGLYSQSLEGSSPIEFSSDPTLPGKFFTQQAKSDNPYLSAGFAERSKEEKTFLFLQKNPKVKAAYDFFNTLPSKTKEKFSLITPTYVKQRAAIFAYTNPLSVADRRNAQTLLPITSKAEGVFKKGVTFFERESAKGYARGGIIGIYMGVDAKASANILQVGADIFGLAKKSPTAAASVVYGVGKFGMVLPKTATATFTSISAYKVYKAPTGKKALTAAEEAATFANFGLLFKGAQIVKRSVVVEGFQVTTPSGNVGNVYAFGVETKGSSFIIGSKTPENKLPRFGKPELKEKIKLRNYGGIEIATVTATGTKAAASVFGLTKGQTIRLMEFRRSILFGQGAKTKSISEFTSGLPFKQQKKSSKILEEELGSSAFSKGGVIGGSKVSIFLPKKYLISGKGGSDIDIHFAETPEQINLRLTKSVTRLRAIGEDVRISKKNPLIIENRKGEKLIEAKSDFEPEAYGSPVANEGGLGFYFKDKTVKFGKFRAMTVGEQFARVTVASAFFRGKSKRSDTPLPFQIGGVYPTDSRTKDITSYLIFGRGIAEQKKQSWNPLQRAIGKSISKSTAQVYRYYNPKQRKVIKQIIAERLASGDVRDIIRIRSRGQRVVEASYSIVKTTRFSSLGIKSPSRRSPSRSRSPSPSRSFSVSPYPSQSFSASPSRFLSRALSPSKSPSPSRSPYKSPSPYRFRPSISPSRSLSPSPSPSPSPSLSLFRLSPPPKFPSPPSERDRRKGKKNILSFNTNSPFSGKYVASVGAIIFNIRGKRPRREEYSTGLTVRPLEV